MKQGLSLRVSQHLALTPQLQQSIRLLQLSTLELSQEIEQMLDDNPFLEKESDLAEREDFGVGQDDAPITADAQSSEAALEQEASANDSSEGGDDFEGSESAELSDYSELTLTPPSDGLSSQTVSDAEGPNEPSSGAEDSTIEGVAESWDGDGSVEFSADDSEWGGDAPPRNGALDQDTSDATELARSSQSLTEFLHRQALSMRLDEVDRAALRFLIESLNDDGYLEDSLQNLAEGLAGDDEEQVE
jgi:RNA polymerase sigma-54 factor